MSVRLRLRREGTKKKPHFRVVAADQRSPRDGRFIEIIGEYHPAEDPSRIEIDNDRALYWLRNGAQPSNTVKKLLRITGAWEEFKPGDEPKRVREPREAKKARKQEQEQAREQEQEQAGEQEQEQTPDATEAEAAEAGQAPAEDGHEDAAAAPAEVEAGDESTPEDDTAEPVEETEDVAEDAAGSPGEGEEKEASK